MNAIAARTAETGRKLLGLEGLEDAAVAQAISDCAAARAKRKRLDATALAQLWMATLQGSLILCKASQDDRVIARNLRQIREHIGILLGGAGAK